MVLLKIKVACLYFMRNFDIHERALSSYVKVRFFSESTDAFVTTLNIRTFFFPETENLNFGDF